MRPLILALTLAACGGGAADPPGASSGAPADSAASESASPPAPADLDACELLTREEVETVIGESVSKVEGTSSADGAASCSWFGVDTGGLRQKGVTLIAAADNGEERWNGHKQLFGKDVKPVDGFGDEAFTDGEIVAGYAGDAFVVVSPLYNDSGVTVEQVKPLGEKVLADLQ